MFEIQNYESFIAAVIAFQLFPGAGTIAILNATARRGIRAGMSSVFGTITGDFIYMLAAVLGLAALLTAYPGMLKLAQWIGVGYLCWMGLGFLRRSVSKTNEKATSSSGEWVSFRQALTVSLTNPKVVVFFVAFFPLFLSEESSSVTMFALMAHVTAISFLYQTGLVLVGNAVSQRLSKHPRVGQAAKSLVGFAFIGFGVKLAFDI